MKTESAQPIIEFQNVGISFDSTVVHRDISFKIYPGEVVTLLGPSGAGKTVILRLIIGLLRPNKGKISVLGSDINELSEEELLPIRQNIGMLFQSGALFDSLTVFENVAYSLRETKNLAEAEIERIVMECLNVVGLPHYRGKLPMELSGGQRKRIGLARALASQPKVVLFDEPTTGLDPTNTQRIDDLIIKLRDSYGITSIVVTHDIASAKRVSDRWLLVNNGIIETAGKVEELLQSNQSVIAFTTGNWVEEK